MPAMTVRNVPDAVHRGLRVRAALHNRSVEAEVRAILDAAVRPQGRVKLGSMLAQIGREVGLTDADVDVFDSVGRGSTVQAARFD